MSPPGFNNWQAVEEEVLSRIRSRHWKPGELIPNESDLAEEFGCARATVNRALRSIADSGLIDRKRKSGTRVALHPVRKATLKIPIIRQEIEQKGHRYSYKVLSSSIEEPPKYIIEIMKLGNIDETLHRKAVHYANDQPYVASDRWINIKAAPAIRDVDLSENSANEWLVTNAHFTRGDISFSAISADASLAKQLHCEEGEALFVIDRTTWNDDIAITKVRLTFLSGYRMMTEI